MRGRFCNTRKHRGRAVACHRACVCTMSGDSSRRPEFHMSGRPRLETRVARVCRAIGRALRLDDGRTRFVIVFNLDVRGEPVTPPEIKCPAEAIDEHFSWLTSERPAGRQLIFSTFAFSLASRNNLFTQPTYLLRS
jgi:hypothetical protein